MDDPSWWVGLFAIFLAKFLDPPLWLLSGVPSWFLAKQLISYHRAILWMALAFVALMVAFIFAIIGTPLLPAFLAAGTFNAMIGVIVIWRSKRAHQKRQAKQDVPELRDLINR
ncbi:hypothetical protein [Paracoccus sp. pheM1]|uniref:hypothetical protein n=1 Tax=Paracoccus sp. pheM1 TaxID=2831675 RepID=UPI001BDB7522|nr:hypothetical protein [Paracoccus sp. pheM1]MBT0780578.1 hypothetical protein [Paracoccus sp. pheM1]